MIQLSPEHILVFTILAIIGCLAISRLCIRAIIRNTKIVKKIIANNNAFKEKMKAKEKMQNSGENHDWFKIPYGTKEVLACRKTGWSPSINGFIAMEHIKQWEERLELDKEYEEYKNAVIAEIAESFKISPSQLQAIAAEVFKMKQNFYLQKMDASVRDMKDDKKV